MNDAKTQTVHAIEFTHPLPAMNTVDQSPEKPGWKPLTGTLNNEEFACPGLLTTRDPALGRFIWNLRRQVYADRKLVVADGEVVMCSINWIRDHTHQLKAFRHWEWNIRSFLDFIISRQREDGQFFELLKQLDDPHWSFVSPDCRIMYPEDSQSLVRLEIEADVEYLVVEAAMRVWRVTGDDDWLRRVLPRLEKGIDYQTSDPKRWEPALGLAKRAFTIDTWDFMDGVSSLAPLNRKIFPDTPMSIMHGDNSGIYQAMNQLAQMNEHLGRTDRAAAWRERAAALREAMMRHLWNGKFFVHQLHLNHKGLDDREGERLSLSNAYALNRGLLTLQERRAVIGEYMRRRETTAAFAEWFSIDPPYAKFSGQLPGRYVNGGISPFTAGELALGAFTSGCEEYGYDIVTRMRKMSEKDGGIFFLYSPEDSRPLGGGPSGWGAAAFLNAIDEGLAGIVDVGTGYSEIEFSPRWPVTEYTELRYLTGYEKTHRFVDCRYVLADGGLRYRLKSPASRIDAHILLPRGRAAAKMLVNGAATPFTVSRPGDLEYADARLERPAASGASGASAAPGAVWEADIEVIFA